MTSPVTEHLEEDFENRAVTEGTSSSARQERDDGGVAFPMPGYFGPSDVPGGTFVQIPQYGMSLRDYFAGQALAGVAQASASERMLGFIEHKDMVAEYAYAMADAMLKRRAK